MPESKVQRRRLALLGATGRTGHQILQKLLQEPIVGSISTSTFAQGQSLAPSSPSLSSYPHLTIFHGSLNDKTLIRECLAQVDTIICTIGENENIPGVTVLQDSARVTLTALSSLKNPNDKNENTIPPPPLIRNMEPALRSDPSRAARLDDPECLTTT